MTYNKGEIHKAEVRPQSYNIKPEVTGNALTFILDRPRNLSVEVNDDIFHNLHLFANPVDSFVLDKKDKDLIYFGPGIHRFENGEFKIPSRKTVYVAGGAVIMGRMLIEDVEHVRLLGRGIIDCSVKMGIRISRSRNVLVEGLFTTQCATGGSDNVTIRNVKSISYYGWGDGMNVFASNNVLFDRVFAGIPMTAPPCMERVKAIKGDAGISPCRTPYFGQTWRILFLSDCMATPKSRKSWKI